MIQCRRAFGQSQFRNRVHPISVIIECSGAGVAAARLNGFQLFVEMYAAKADVRTKVTSFAMLGFQDQVGAVEERSSERMNFRTKPSVKQAIQQAAALSGVDDSVFTINAAYRSALETIAAHERAILQPVDYQAFFAALDTPPAPTDRLRAAYLRHRETITSS